MGYGHIQVFPSKRFPKFLLSRCDFILADFNYRPIDHNKDRVQHGKSCLLESSFLILGWIRQMVKENPGRDVVSLGWPSVVSHSKIECNATGAKRIRDNVNNKHPVRGHFKRLIYK